MVITSIDLNYDSEYSGGYVTIRGDIRDLPVVDGVNTFANVNFAVEYVWGRTTGTSAEVSYNMGAKKALGLNRLEHQNHAKNENDFVLGDLVTSEYITFFPNIHILQPVYFSDKKIGAYMHENFMIGYLYKEEVYPSKSGATVLAGEYSDDCQCIKGAWYQSDPGGASVFIAIRKMYNKEDSVCFYLWSQTGVIRKNCVKDPGDKLGLAQKSCTLDLAKRPTDDLAFNIDTELDNTMTVNV